MEDKKVILEVNHLSVDFRIDRKTTLHAVRDVSFKLHEGETLGILGESGCGKSVTCMSILQLLPVRTTSFPTGEILFEGQDLLKLTGKQLRPIRGNDIAMIFQEPMTALNPLYTIGNQLLEAIRIHDKNVSKAEAYNRCVEMLHHVRIPNPERIMASYPHTLSGGMLQRCMIAMAMMAKPKLLICDEPTTALDVTIQAQVLELMARLKEENGTSIIFVTHDLGVINEISDRVLVMYGGKKAEEGPTTEVFGSPVHPYTKGLIESYPTPDFTGTRLPAIGGSVPTLYDMPKGCPFSNRCTSCMDCCSSEAPEEVGITEQHSVCCHLFNGKEDTVE